MTESEPTQVIDRSAWAARFHSRVHRYTHLLRRRWWILGLTLSAALALQSYRIQQIPPTFVSTGRMIVNAQLSIPGVTDNTQYQEELQNFFGTQVALMQSSIVTNRAAERLLVLKPELTPCPVELKVSQAPRTSIFILRAEGDEPEYTRTFLDACMEEYIRYKQEQQTQTSDTTLSAITAELTRLEKDLRAGEQELLEFQKENNLVFLEEQGNSASRYLASVNVKLADLRIEHELLERLDLDQNLERQKQVAADASPAGLKSTSYDLDYLKNKSQVQMLKAELKDWSQYMRPKHPKIIKLTEEIARQENLIEIFRQQNLGQLTSRRESVKLQIQNLEAVVKEWEAKSLDASRRVGEFQKIKTKNQRAQSLYDRLLSTVQSVDVGKNLKQERITILERATAAQSQKPGLVRSLVLAGILGLGLGIALLWLADRLNDRPTSFTELHELFEEPILGQIPQDRTAKKKERVKPLELEDPRHAFAEAYRNLRSALLFMPQERKGCKALLVTSAIPGEGKSTISADLAITLAHGGARVLLVDADLRRGIMHDFFKTQLKPGLADVLLQESSWSNALATDSVPNLTLLSRGENPARPGEMFLSPSMDVFLRESRERFDYIIIDSAPVLAADDCANLAPKVDGVLFVVRADYTSARLARNALTQLYQRQAKILGLVFNAVDVRGREYYYYKYSNYYYYGSKKSSKKG